MRVAHLAVLGAHPVCLPDGHVADELAHVLHVVDVLGEQVALHLQPVRVTRETRRCKQKK